jgi:hypothetical protein
VIVTAVAVESLRLRDEYDRAQADYLAVATINALARAMKG